MLEMLIRLSTCTDYLATLKIPRHYPLLNFSLSETIFSLRKRIIFTLRQVGIPPALARYFSLSRLALSIPAVEIFNYLATGECDKDCFRRDVTEHLSAGSGWRGGEFPARRRLICNGEIAFSFLLLSRRGYPRKREYSVRKRARSHQSCSEKTQDDRGVVLNVTDVTLILFRRSQEKRT